MALIDEPSTTIILKEKIKEYPELDAGDIGEIMYDGNGGYRVEFIKNNNIIYVDLNTIKTEDVIIDKGISITEVLFYIFLFLVCLFSISGIASL